MDDDLKQLRGSLAEVSSSKLMKFWVSSQLRSALPHATFLGTFGKLYGVGSVPTHRVDVDFPLTILEELKNSAGAIDDPLMYGWFKNERLRYLDMSDLPRDGDVGSWRTTLTRFGIRSMLIHGVLDHAARRFAIFQIGNPFNGGSLEAARLLKALVPGMAETCWKFIDRRYAEVSRHLVGHPTLSLTQTEMQIVELIAQGLSNKQIARRRGVSDSTVKTQVQRTGAKLGATRRAEIVAIALPMLAPLPPQTLIDFDDDYA